MGDNVCGLLHGDNDAGTSPVLPCGCVRPGSSLIKVSGLIAGVDPPLSSSSLDLVCGVCPRCFTRRKYTMIEYLRPLDMVQMCLRCSTEIGDNVYLRLELYTVLKIQDKRDKSIVYNAVAGKKLQKKLKFCSPKEYIANPLSRLEIWNRLKKLCTCRSVELIFYLSLLEDGQYQLTDIKIKE